MSEAILLLEDGRTFRGESFGAGGEVFGEIVFDTAMSGYQEVLTDPAHGGRVLLFTAPHIGNTGWNDDDGASAQISAAGIVVRDPAPRPSNWRSTRSLDDVLREQGIVGIHDIDTRALTRHIRGRGTVRAAISTVTLDGDRLLQALLTRPSGDTTSESRKDA